LTKLENRLSAAKSALEIAKKEAETAEAIIAKDLNTLIAKQAAKATLNPREAGIISRAMEPLRGQKVAIAGGAALLLDGAIRLLATINGKNAGIFPTGAVLVTGANGVLTGRGNVKAEPKAQHADNPGEEGTKDPNAQRAD
jgi:hypothetical protein